MKHIIGTVEDDCTLCGIKRNSPEALPYTWFRWLNGHEADLCPDCVASAGTRSYEAFYRWGGP